MFNTANNSVTMIDSYKGDATGVAAVLSLHKVYTAEGGQVYIYWHCRRLIARQLAGDGGGYGLPTWPTWTPPAMSTTPPIDVLAIAAHRDDVEQTCGGTLLRMRSLQLRTAILDLTQGEAGTRGSAGERAQEAEEAARILGVAWREALDIPDGRVENTWENRLKIVRKLRQLRPRVVILPYWQGRHPDHYNSSTLGYEACFLSGLAKIDTGDPPFRPFKIVYASPLRGCAAHFL